MSGILDREYLSTENDWAMAISTDNSTKADEILQNPSGPSAKYILLHTQLSVLSPLDKTCQKYPHRSHFLPLHLAVICHAKDVMKSLVQNGVDVTQLDDKGNNVVHTLITVSSHAQCKDRENSIAMYHLLITLISEQNMKFCLHQEDANGLRPLELAASLGHFQMMNAIFHTPGVYLCKSEIRGFQLQQYFRVTEYEKYSDRYLSNRPERDHVSPLRLMVQLNQCSVDMIQAKTSLLCEPMSTWVLSKLQRNWWLMTFHLMVGVMELVSFFIVTRPRWLETENSGIFPSAGFTKITTKTSVGICVSIPETNKSALAIIICFSGLKLMVNIYGIFIGNTLLQIQAKLTFRNIPCTGYSVLVDLSSSITIVTYCLLSVWLPLDTKIASVIFNVLCLGLIACALRSVIRWGLAVESVREYAMTLATVSSDYGHIFHIVILFSLVFGTVLEHLRVHDTPHHFRELPLSYLDSLHKTFLLLLNIESVENIQTNHTFLLKEFHVIGNFSIVVLLFNFLIASMVNTYGYIRSNFGVYSIMYNLDAALYFQDCVPAIMVRLHSYLMHRSFVVQNDDVYVVRVTTIDKS